MYNKEKKKIFGDEYESDFVRDSIALMSLAPMEKRKRLTGQNRYVKKAKREQICTYKPGLSVFNSGSGDYLCAVHKRNWLSFNQKNVNIIEYVS